jgi:ribosomal protein L37AE/L43A
MTMRIIIACPHCESRAVARSSQQLSITLREITYQCQDVYCGHTYVAQLEVVRTLSPSAKPNTAVDLPVVGRPLQVKRKLPPTSPTTP